MNTWRLTGEAEQIAFGRQLARVVPAGAVIFLRGDLGAGKTTLARGFLQGRGHKGSVRSPTYTLIEPYTLPGGTCYHLDLYRLGDPEELEYLGLREMLQEEAVMLVEWPQRGEDWLPTPDLEVLLSYASEGDSREITLTGFSLLGNEIVSDISSSLLA